ncbi:hypothetical protein EDB84DRAFT_1561828 [Lactarius hengduanensis]|nr:hypothetical protein EDB84DRAFT_1561828 [Lactarius hengduanensis]
MSPSSSSLLSCSGPSHPCSCSSPLAPRPSPRSQLPTLLEAIALPARNAAVEEHAFIFVREFQLVHVRTMLSLTGLPLIDIGHGSSLRVLFALTAPAPLTLERRRTNHISLRVRRLSPAHPPSLLSPSSTVSLDDKTPVEGTIVSTASLDGTTLVPLTLESSVVADLKAIALPACDAGVTAAACLFTPPAHVPAIPAPHQLWYDPQDERHTLPYSPRETLWNGNA